VVEVTAWAATAVGMAAAAEADFMPVATVAAASTVEDIGGIAVVWATDSGAVAGMGTALVPAGAAIPIPGRGSLFADNPINEPGA
jgi:hypothetical protein